MQSRRELLIRLGRAGLVVPVLAGRIGPAEAAGRRPPAPGRPIPFDSPDADPILAGLRVFPADNPWNVDVSDWPVHPNSERIIASIGLDRPLRSNRDMAFILVPPDQRRVPVRITTYPGESDRGPFPVPDTLPIEGWPAFYKSSGDPKMRALSLEDVQRDRSRLGGDRHAIVVDPVGLRLYEFYGMRRAVAGWEAAQASVFDLGSNRLRPEGWTSSDAAGLPVFPAVVRFDELERGVIRHALRVTVRRTRRSYVAPARHSAGRSHDPDLPAMGERIRMKRRFDVSGFSPHLRTILEALKRQGMLVADNGIDWAISVAPDGRIPDLNAEMRRIPGSAFEVVRGPAGAGQTNAVGIK